jgi:hypothetical protein
MSLSLTFKTTTTESYGHETTPSFGLESKKHVIAIGFKNRQPIDLLI